MRKKQSDMVRVVKDAITQEHGVLTETEAAGLIGVSRSWFRHVFKREARTSFRTMRLRAKLARGAELLSSTTLGIEVISSLLGYSDRSKFEKAFKREYGFTPASYRLLPFVKRFGTSEKT